MGQVIKLIEHLSYRGQLRALTRWDKTANTEFDTRIHKSSIDINGVNYCLPKDVMFLIEMLTDEIDYLRGGREYDEA
jgi:hypothetical protein